MFGFSKWVEQTVAKPWNAKKDEILPFWTNLQNSTPIIPFKPAPPNVKGSTLNYDGIRVTGSSQFINAVMSRLKDLMNYESETSRLHLIYKQQVDKNTQLPLPNSFAFYAQVRDRDKKNDFRQI